MRTYPLSTTYLRGLLPRPAIHRLSAHCLRRRVGELAKIWCLSLWVLCTYGTGIRVILDFYFSNRHLVHASDADQAEELLTRWGPDGLGKLGGEESIRHPPPTAALSNLHPHVDPRWASPIKNRIRQGHQARAINEVVNALKPSLSNLDNGPAPLHVVNGMSTPTSSTLTTAARENVPISPINGLPGPPVDSTFRWGGGLMVHPEHDHEDNDVLRKPSSQRLPSPCRQRSIIPSLATLEKAVSARIFFENLYFPILRHPPSREQRKLAMEQDMLSMGLSEARKEELRARWRQNETDYLREKRRKVDVSAFVKLKTIGHGKSPHDTFCQFFVRKV